MTKQKAELIEITPSMATEMLESSDINYRRLSDARVEQFAQDIKSNKWELNGETIKVNDKGSVIDGQHRLWAIIVANKSIKTWVIRGVDNYETILSTIDTGRARTFADVLRRKGVKNAAVAASTVRNAMLLEAGKITDSKRRLSSHREQLAFYKNHAQDISDAIAMSHRIRSLGLMPAARIATLAYMFNKINKTKAAAFMHGVGHHNSLGQGHPCYVLHEQLAKVRDKKLKVGRFTRMAWFILAWNAFVTGKSFTNGKIEWDGKDFPKIDDKKHRIRRNK